VFKRRGRHSFGNLKRPRFNFAAGRRSETALSFGNLTVSKGDRDKKEIGEEYKKEILNPRIGLGCAF